MPKTIQELQNLSLATSYEIDDTFDSDKFIKMRLRVCHDGINPNKSEFEVADMENAAESIKNIPVLANVIFDENGDVQFGGHDMEIEEDKCNEGEYKLIYKETPIGVIPELCNHKIEKFNNKNYVFCDAYIWKGYSNYAQNIIERDKDIKLSMEIMVDSYSYNAKKKCYKITDYRYQGITFLNKNFGTGMENALATTENFSEDNLKEKFILMMSELKESLDLFNNKNKTEEGGKVLDKKIELLMKYGLTVETVTFDISEMSFEDLEIKLNEMYSKDGKTTNVEEFVSEENEIKELKEEFNNEVEKFQKIFELSHSDIRYALYQLLSLVESSDNEWYFIDQVFDSRFEYENWDGTKIFRQGYVKDGDSITFEGDRVELFQERLTKEEKDALDKMRGEFSLLKSEKETLESDFSKLKEENESLKEFKLAKETIEKEKVFAQFEGLTEDDIADIKANISDYTIDILEEKLFAIWGKKKMELEKGKNFSKKEKKEENKEKLIFGLVDSENKEIDAPIYADIINKHKK